MYGDWLEIWSRTTGLNQWRIQKFQKGGGRQGGRQCISSVVIYRKCIVIYILMSYTRFIREKATCSKKLLRPIGGGAPLPLSNLNPPLIWQLRWVAFFLTFQLLFCTFVHFFPFCFVSQSDKPSRVFFDGRTQCCSVDNAARLLLRQPYRVIVRFQRIRRCSSRRRRRRRRQRPLHPGRSDDVRLPPWRHLPAARQLSVGRWRGTSRRGWSRPAAGHRQRRWLAADQRRFSRGDDFGCDRLCFGGSRRRHGDAERQRHYDERRTERVPADRFCADRDAVGRIPAPARRTHLPARR